MSIWQSFFFEREREKERGVYDIMEIKVIENQFFKMEYFCGALSVGLSSLLHRYNRDQQRASFNCSAHSFGDLNLNKYTKWHL